MPIYIYESREPVRFPSSHSVHIEMANNRHLITLTGVAISGFTGGSPDWVRNRLSLSLNYPTYFIPSGKQFHVDQWAPFVTINAIRNDDTAKNAGWAVDSFGGPGRGRVWESIPIWADLAVSDLDGHLIRVGYTLTVYGSIVDYEERPII
jgi:hypothetical protein